MSIRNFLVPLLLAVVVGSGAVPAVARAQQKIAYVDLQRALNEVEEGKAAKAGLKREFDQKQKLLDERKTEFDKLRGDVEKQSAVMSDEARREKQADLERRGMELQGFFVQLQKELSDREREATRGIFEKMHGLVKEIADAEGVAVVVTAEALIYAQPSLDLTNELVRKYNARFKAGAPAAKSAPTSAKGGAHAKEAAAEKKKKESK
jgi:outer membrane protein